MEIFETINTLRAMRRLKTDPVPDELVWKVLDAAIRAPSDSTPSMPRRPPGASVTHSKIAA